MTVHSLIKIKWISMLYRTVCFSAILLIVPLSAMSNITQWDGAAAGGPGPVVQSKLELQREKVLFDKGKVHATFWVRNPTSEKITITMGFPVKFFGLEADEKQNYTNDYTNKFLRSFEVRIGSVTVKPEFTKGKKGSYPYVYTWTMLFLPHSLIDFTVTYLMYPSHVGRPGAEDTRKFTYITHTGSNWAGPINTADLHFCDQGLLKFIRTPPGEYWAENGMITYGISWEVRPTPYSINEETSCIEWHRTNWKPVKNVDDIIVNYSFTSGTDYRSGGVEPCWDGDCENVKEPKNFDLEAIMDNWCKAGDVTPFAETTSITQLNINDSIFDGIESDAYFRYDPVFQTYNTLPEHLRTDYQLLLLRYLRNYIFARHGHKFKDERLGACFSGITQALTWNAAEKINVDWMLAKEKALKKINGRAWDSVRKKTIKSPGIFGLF